MTDQNQPADVNIPLSIEELERLLVIVHRKMSNVEQNWQAHADKACYDYALNMLKLAPPIYAVTTCDCGNPKCPKEIGADQVIAQYLKNTSDMAISWIQGGATAHIEGINLEDLPQWAKDLTEDEAPEETIAFAIQCATIGWKDIDKSLEDFEKITLH